MNDLSLPAFGATLCAWTLSTIFIRAYRHKAWRTTCFKIAAAYVTASLVSTTIIGIALAAASPHTGIAGMFFAIFIMISLMVTTLARPDVS